MYLGNQNLFVIHVKKKKRGKKLALSQLEQVSSTMVWGQLKLDEIRDPNYSYLQYLLLELSGKADQNPNPQI